MSAMDPELHAVLVELGFKAGQSITAEQINERLSASYSRGLIEGARLQREADAAEVLSIAATFREDSAVRVYLEATIDHLKAQPLVSSTEGTPE